MIKNQIAEKLDALISESEIDKEGLEEEAKDKSDTESTFEGIKKTQIEDISYDTSEFVDKTQLSITIANIDDVHLRNEKFLKDLWDNSIDKDDNSDEEVIDTNLDNFQHILTKSQKRKRRQKMKPKKAYGTRSKYGLEKPSK